MAKSPTRYPGGVTNRAAYTAMGKFKDMDPTWAHEWFRDFDIYTAGDWTVTATGSGTSAIATGETGGVLVLTNAAADDDRRFLQWGAPAETWKFVVGKETWFKTRFKVSDATQSDFIMGLQITDTTPLAVSDGVYFRKDDGDAFLDAVVVKGSTATTGTAIKTLADNTYYEMVFYYDGNSEVQFWVDDVLLAVLATTNLPDTEELTLSFGIQNGEAVAKSMSIDYIYISQQR